MLNIPGLEVEDNSAIENYCKCERKYYFSAERRIRPDKPSDALSFGDSWGKAMDAVWSGICWEGMDQKEAISAGIDAFMERWTELGYPDPQRFAELDKEAQDSLSPRTPMTAMEMIYSYVEMREEWLRRIELLEIERPFLVPIDPDNPKRMYAGKLDKVFQENKRIYGLDHKTTSWYLKNGFFRTEFLEGFNPNRQFDGYFHYLRMGYGKKAKGVWADCALVHKNVHEGFRILPIEQQQEHMDAWLWETNVRMTSIARDRERLRQLRESGENTGPVMRAFPRRPESCFLYNRPCEFLDLCRSWSNPEEYPDMPEGFVADTWSPFTDDQIKRLMEAVDD